MILMREKHVLIGRNVVGDKKVVIKISNSKDGKMEIQNEKLAQDALDKAIFSREKLLFPKELLSTELENHVIRITEFIEQDRVFGAYPVEEQFFMILKEFEVEEGFYANTFDHLETVKKTFPVINAKDYAETFKEFKISSGKSEALKLIVDNEDLIETRSNYLTQTDLVPSNFRIKNGQVYMLDLSSMHFANRYEGLARFLNWCIIHNPELEKILIDYIKKNRGEDEYLNLRLMRIYKAGFLIDHYTRKLDKTSDNLHKLTKIRVSLWQNILKNLISDKLTERTIVENYRRERDQLRSQGEVDRQKEFNILSL